MSSLNSFGQGAGDAMQISGNALTQYGMNQIRVEEQKQMFLFQEREKEKIYQRRKKELHSEKIAAENDKLEADALDASNKSLQDWNKKNEGERAAKRADDLETDLALFQSENAVGSELKDKQALASSYDEIIKDIESGSFVEGRGLDLNQRAAMAEELDQAERYHQPEGQEFSLTDESPELASAKEEIFNKYKGMALESANAERQRIGSDISSLQYASDNFWTQTKENSGEFNASTKQMNVNDFRYVMKKRGHSEAEIEAAWEFSQTAETKQLDDRLKIVDKEVDLIKNQKTTDASRYGAEKSAWATVEAARLGREKSDSSLDFKDESARLKAIHQTSKSLLKSYSDTFGSFMTNSPMNDGTRSAFHGGVRNLMKNHGDLGDQAAKNNGFKDSDAAVDKLEVYSQIASKEFNDLTDEAKSSLLQSAGITTRDPWGPGEIDVSEAKTKALQKHNTLASGLLRTAESFHTGSISGSKKSSKSPTADSTPKDNNPNPGVKTSSKDYSTTKWKTKEGFNSKRQELKAISKTRKLTAAERQEAKEMQAFAKK